MRKKNFQIDNEIIDVSSNNGDIDWPLVAADDVRNAIIRLSLGYNTMDYKAIENANGAYNSGIIVSYYHFGYPDKADNRTLEEDAQNEAGYFSGLINNLPNSSMIAIDLEEEYTSPWGNGNGDTNLDESEYLSWLSIFLNDVYAATGKVCMIYSYADYLNRHLPEDHGLGGIPLWISNTNNISSPPLPNGWESYFLWQYTDVGSISGINTVVDLDRTALRAFLSSRKKMKKN